MKKITIILTLFFFDRLIKIYLINLQATGTDIDYYIFSFFNNSTNISPIIPIVIKISATLNINQ